jgi:hypothetical protein
MKSLYKKRLNKSYKNYNSTHSNNGSHIYNKQAYSCGCGCDGTKQFKLKGKGYIKDDGTYEPNKMIENNNLDFSVQTIKPINELSESEQKQLIDLYNEFDKSIKSQSISEREYDKEMKENKGGSLTVATITASITALKAFYDKAMNYYKKYQKYDNELHPVFYKNFSFKIANWCGGNTEVIKRLKDNKNNKAVSFSDLLCKLHDINILLKVKNSDELFLKQLDEAKNKNLDNKFNIYIASNIVKSKTLLKKYAFPIISSFKNSNTKNKSLSSSDIKLLKKFKLKTEKEINNKLS